MPNDARAASRRCQMGMAAAASMLRMNTHHPLPACLLAAGPGRAAAEEPHPDGLDAHRAGRSARRLPAHGRVLCRTRARRRGHDHHRRHLAQRRRRHRQQAVHARRGRTAQAHHPGRARRRPRGEDLHADPAHRRAGRHAGLRGAVAGEVAHRPPHAPRAGRSRHREAAGRLRELRGAGQSGGLRRRGDHRLGRLPAVDLPGAQDQSAHRPLGRPLGKPHALPGGGGAARARGRGRALPRHLPHRGDGHAGRRPGLGRDRLAGPWRWWRRAPTSSARISAGTRRRCRPSPRWCRAPPSRR